MIANGTSNAALVAPGGVAGGATISCGGLDVRGALALQAANFVLDGVTFTDCGGLSPGNCTSAIHFYGRPFASGGEVAGCRVVGGCRAIWLQTHKRVFIHHCVIENACKHTVDFDSFSRDSVVWASNISGSAQEAVFIEQGAENIFVAGNLLTDNAVGVGVYNNLFPVLTQNHFVVGNTIRGSTRYALTAGSIVGVNGTPASAVSFFGNVIDATVAVGGHASGAQVSTLFVGNADAAGFDAAALAAKGSVLSPDPLGRARAVPPSASATRSRTPSATAPPGASGSDTPSAPPSGSGTCSGSGSPSPSGATLAAPGGGEASGPTAPLVGDPAGAVLWGCVGFALGCAGTVAAARWRGRAAGGGLASAKPAHHWHPALHTRQGRSSVRRVLGSSGRP